MSRNNNILPAITAAIIAGILLLAMCCLHSCKCPCSVIENNTTDSTEIQVIPRDTVIITKADSASLRALLKCDSAYNVVLFDLACLQGDRIEADSHVQHTSDGGMVLTLNCKEDSLEQIIHMQDSIIKSFRAQTIIKTIEVENKFQKGCTIALWCLIGALVLSLIVGIIIKFAK